MLSLTDQMIEFGGYHSRLSEMVYRYLKIKLDKSFIEELETGMRRMN